MSAESTASRGVPNQRERRFHHWRGGRPFWAGLFTMIGGVPIAYFPYADLRLGNMTIAMATTGGAGALIIGVLLVTLGLTMWFQPIVRVFAGVAAIVLALVSIPVSNLGGFFMGFLLALVGGGLSVAWAPGTPEDGTKQPSAEPVGERAEAETEAVAGEHEYDGQQHGTEAVEETHAVDFAKAPVPEQRAGEEPDPQAGPGAQATETTIDANGGRNSAG
ncbi:DUF6114 domain-containing protein [Streptomyces sp. P9(2023)]|uniref:DUF6114 domain-containing protein n=1 Tax=Streptomyces sp. P9(2023) TaxID=3064394 RepID=UPI0028F44C54|nr:DUF6114 domain-containing protein [Streptomyces sp. P9(2023)]MDT9689779.1 DUF6114 domain-containing protein [Streptomyces sp. P9(2023)]